MGDKQCNFGRNRSVMNGSLLHRSFGPYLSSHYSAVAETTNLTLLDQALQAIQVWLKSVGNERHFTRVNETVFLP
jgi:hypothetical protein